jgi:hypothetical protein
VNTGSLVGAKKKVFTGLSFSHKEGRQEEQLIKEIYWISSPAERYKAFSECSPLRKG